MAFQWLRELLELRQEISERKAILNKRVCESCETLKHQLEVANFEKKQLLEKLLYKDVPQVAVEPPTTIIPPKHIPWNIKKQILEAEDREKAKLLRQAPKPESIEDLEKELDIAAEKREKEG